MSLVENKKILLVDDDHESLKMMKAALDWEGYVVDMAESGKVAIDKISADKCPHLILLDINMPGLDGLETLQLLRSNTEHISIIFVSADSDTDAVIRGLDAGADDYICKPFNPMELLARVKAQLRVKTLYDELQQANLKLKHLAETDDLTGLFNMRFLYDKLNHEIERINRYGGYVSAVMMDLDNFKKVNDGHDHLFGSYVLSEVGKILRRNTRQVDFAARYGGDEFLVVLAETDWKGAMVFSERIRRTIKKALFSNDNYEIQLTMSLGVSTVASGQQVTAQQLIRFADFALYEAKKAGKNCTKYREIGEDDLLAIKSSGTNIELKGPPIEAP